MPNTKDRFFVYDPFMEEVNRGSGRKQGRIERKRKKGWDVCEDEI